MPEIVFSGLGMVTPLGNNPDDIWQKLLTKQSAAKVHDDLMEEGFHNAVACRISNNRNSLSGCEMALQAVHAALCQSQINLHNKNTGVFVGSTIGESSAFERRGEGLDVDDENLSLTLFADTIQHELGITGMTRTYGTACAAGNYAIYAAAEELRKGNIDVAIAGAVDPFSRIAFTGFQRSRAMAGDGICRPFDRRRLGMILGEGAAFFVLEREKDMLRRNAIPLAIAGRCGLSADAHHPTAPRSDGAGMAISMSHALSRQGLRPEQIDWVCAHGSGTMLSDNAEALAIRDVFGSQMSVSALKGALGHALAAASAIEAAICILSLRHQCIPPSINFEEPDPAIDIRILDKPSYQPIRWVMNCGYAFGGLNSSLIIGKWN